MSKMANTSDQTRHFSHLSIGHSKSSFDRFGDDLMELMLSHLSIDDKFRLECMSRQTRRVIFCRQHCLRLDMYSIDREVSKFSHKFFRFNRECRSGPTLELLVDRLETVLRKLTALTTLEFEDSLTLDSALFRMIAKYCPQLRHFSVGNWVRTDRKHMCVPSVEHFGRTCGHKLKTLRLNNREIGDEYVRCLLDLCPNLTSTNVKLDLLLHPTPRPPLREVVVRSLTKIDDIIQFQTHYAQTVTKLKTNLNIENLTQMKAVFEGLGRFVRLQSLEVVLFCDGDGIDCRQIIDAFRHVSDNCTKLTELKIRFDLRVPYRPSPAKPVPLKESNLFALLGRFLALRSLKVAVDDYERHPYPGTLPNYGSVSDLKELRHLQHLSLEMDLNCDEWFANIAKHLPQLRSIKVINHWPVTDIAVNHISRLSRLSSLYIWAYNETGGLVTDAGVNTLLDRCSHLKKLVLITNLDFTRVFDLELATLEAIKLWANRNPKILYYFMVFANDLFATSPAVARLLQDLSPNLDLHLVCDIETYGKIKCWNNY